MWKEGCLEKTSWEALRDDVGLDQVVTRSSGWKGRYPAGGAERLPVGREVRGREGLRMTTVSCLVFIGAGGRQMERKHLFGNILKPTEKLQE